MCISSCMQLFNTCTINSKINGTLMGVYLVISKLHSILVVANLLATSKQYPNTIIFNNIIAFEII